MNADRLKFISDHKNDVINGVSGSGLFPSVTMAQMILESSNSMGQAGQGVTAVKANNYFGIKASSNWNGQTMSFNTPNDSNPVSLFRVYPSVKDSVADHTKFLEVNSRYANAGVFSAKTPEDQAYALAKAGYSEKPYPQYADALISLINTYNLKELDVAAQKKKSTK
jgi:flagellum-specific peptidoglycan hydrolase FlgJ